LVALAGLTSGLTLCIFSLDPAALDATAIDPKETETTRSRARRLVPLMRHQHWVLVALVVVNSSSYEILPLVLESMLSPLISIVIATAAILIFGAVLPQALFTRYALSVASFFVPFVWLVMVLTAPISFTLAKALDCIIGHKEAVALQRVELRQLIALGTFSQSLRVADADERRLLESAEAQGVPLIAAHDEAADLPGLEGIGGTLTLDEVRLLTGALGLSELTVREAMAPDSTVTRAMMFCETEIVTAHMIRQISASGHSRVPVYRIRREHIVGYVHVRCLLPLIHATPESARSFRELGIVRDTRRCNARDLLIDVYDHFFVDGAADENDASLFVVHDDATGDAVGILTRSDVLAQLHGAPLRDEAAFEADELARAAAAALLDVVRGAASMASHGGGYSTARHTGATRTTGHHGAKTSACLRHPSAMQRGGSHAAARKASVGYQFHSSRAAHPPRGAHAHHEPLETSYGAMGSATPGTTMRRPATATAAFGTRLTSATDGGQSTKSHASARRHAPGVNTADTNLRGSAARRAPQDRDSTLDRDSSSLGPITGDPTATLQ
jgi:CBS domain containing-hemolysin-like protein